MSNEPNQFKEHPYTALRLLKALDEVIYEATTERPFFGWDGIITREGEEAAALITKFKDGPRNTVSARNLRYTHLARQVSVTLDGKTYDGVLQGINRDLSQRDPVRVLITSSDGAVVVGSLDLPLDHEVTIK